ncbi:hypothetical protein MTO96_001799 [Rhipicephalus appendiculatus]
MKKLVLILVVVLLCEVVSTQAVRRTSGGSDGRKPPIKCNGKICKSNEYCEDREEEPPHCARNFLGR